jgi:DNA polymerase I-like protein with 3'-5' exonuclease and polymerase domains
MRRYRKANLLMTKLMTMRSRIRPDGRIDFSQKYCGAHTKRTSGDQGFNVQGFQRDPFEGVDMRRAVHAMNGGNIVIADLAQIEPRTLAWLVDDSEKISMINKGISVYQVHAIQTLNYKGENLKKEDPHLYAMCKMRVLGLSYGCGAERFVDYCWSQYGHRITLRDAKLQVGDFRRKERLIVNFWNKIQRQFEVSVGDDLQIMLPSWNSMQYRNVRRDKGQLTATLATGRVNRMWGSLGVENIIQATARDCFYEKLLKIEDAGIPTLFAVHDEVITDEVPADQTKDALDIVNEIMRKECSWMPGIALDSETHASPHYLK